MDKSRYLSALREDDARFVELARRDLTARVPGCPEWSVGELVVHLGGVYEWVTTVLTSGSTERADIESLFEQERPTHGANRAGLGEVRRGSFVVRAGKRGSAGAAWPPRA